MRTSERASAMPTSLSCAKVSSGAPAPVIRAEVRATQWQAALELPREQGCRVVDTWRCASPAMSIFPALLLVTRSFQAQARVKMAEAGRREFLPFALGAASLEMLSRRAALSAFPSLGPVQAVAPRSVPSKSLRLLRETSAVEVVSRGAVSSAFPLLRGRRQQLQPLPGVGARPVAQRILSESPRWPSRLELFGKSLQRWPRAAAVPLE